VGGPGDGVLIMAMAPGLGFRRGGFKFTMPVNEYGEFANDYEIGPGMLLKDKLDIPYRSREVSMGMMRQPLTGAEASNAAKKRASAEKALGKAMKLSKDSKFYRNQLQNIEREFELKKMKGIPIDERDMRKYWDTKDRMDKIRTDMDYLYGNPDRNKKLSAGLNYKTRSDTYGGTSEQFNRGTQ